MHRLIVIMSIVVGRFCYIFILIIEALDWILRAISLKQILEPYYLLVLHLHLYTIKPKRKTQKLRLN